MNVDHALDRGPEVLHTASLGLRGRRIRSLLSADQPGIRAGRAVHLIAELVRQADPGAMWVFRASRSRRGSGLVLEVGANDAAGADWPASIEYALRGIARLGATGGFDPHPNPIHAAVELCQPRAPITPASFEIDTDSVPPRSQPLPRQAQLIQPLITSSAELYELLGTVPGGMYVVALAPTNAIEQAMLADDLAKQWSGSEADYQLYHSAAVRCRAFLTTSSERLPATIRAELRMASRNVHLRDLPADELAGLENLRPEILAGHGVALGALLGLLRLPAAGTATFPGIRCERSRSAAVALDPLPKKAGARAVQLGWARTSGGRRVPVKLSGSDLLQNLHVIGQPGSGKTTALTNWACQLPEAGVGFIALDFHGDHTPRVMSNYAGGGVPIWSIDYSRTDTVAPLNPLVGADDLRFATNLSAVVEALRSYVDPHNDGRFGERASRTVSLIANGYRALGTVTIPVVAETVASQDLCRKLAVRLNDVGSPLAAQVQQELARLDGSDARDFFSWMASRMYGFLDSPALTRILGTGANAVDLVELMDHSQGLVVDLGAATLGRNSSRFLLGLWLTMIREAMFRRTRRDRPFVVIVDEAHLAQFGPLASILDEGRKFGIGVVVAHQRLGQLSTELADALEANAASFVSLRCGLADGGRASVRLGGWPVQDLVHMPAFQAAATLSRAGVPTEPFTLMVDRPRSRNAVGQQVAQHRIDEIEARSARRFIAPFAGRKVISAQTAVTREPPGPRQPEPASTVRHPLQDLVDDFYQDRAT